MSARPPPVPGRECGECTYCCQYLPIDTPELQLMPGTLCSCNSGKSCTIYETRPQACRDYMCGWRLFPALPEDWRPDTIGVLATVVNAGIPPGYMQEGIELLLVKPNEALARTDFLQFIYKSVAVKVPLFLCLPGPIGSFAVRAFLNAPLEEIVRGQDQEGFIKALQKILDDLKEIPFKAAAFKHGGAHEQKPMIEIESAS